MSIAVNINGLDHSITVLERTLLTETLQNRVKLTRRDQAIAVLIVQRKRLSELLGGARIAAGSGVKLGEFAEIDESVAVFVHLLHHSLHLLRRSVGSQGLEKLPELHRRYLAVAISVEFLENFRHFFGGVLRHWRGLRRRESGEGRAK
uniref:Uncharacterized protein n=1 Tax=Opuntia streptacantha TaxID=393608 RepID=A0A7C8Z8M4_OPUST